MSTPDQQDSKWDDSEFHQSQQIPWWQAHQRELAIFGGLSLVLLVVVFWLPNLVDPVAVDEASSSPSVTETSQGAGTTRPASSTNATLESPWEEAQIAKARREAQEILAKLLDKQNTLEGMQVNLWAADKFQQAMDSASKGDELYRARDFMEAQNSYQTALDQFEQLITQAETEFQQAMTAGEQAIDDQQPQAAIDAYSLATAIRPRNNEAREGLARAQVQEDVILLLEKAENARLQYQLSDARQAIEEALELDSLSRHAAEQLQQIKIAIAEANYANAMGQGYQALQNDQYQNAIAQFEKALKIQPGNQAAKDAIIQAENQRTQNQIQNTLVKAQQAEKAEQWQAALDAYQKAQKLDKSLVSARIGALRSEARVGLDKQLQKLIVEPLRLADPAVYRSAQALLKDARSVKPRGTRIDQQVNQLSQALAKALDPVAVLLRSDNQTQVTVYKVGKLGLFTEHQLSLKPGRYTIVGSRSGYRDVREEITLQPGSHQKTVTIQCDEKIALGS